MNTPVLAAEALTIGYKTRRQQTTVAADINVTLHAGELACLIGPNGAGKSTLLRTVAGMQKPLSGSVSLAGDNIAQLSAIERARRLSIVLTERPDAGLMTGYALVALGRHPHTGWSGQLSAQDERAVREAVTAVGADNIANKPIGEMSDGQRQKIMIARALAQQPALLLLDEPTAYLDLPRRVEIMRLLRDIARDRKRAVLLSTHDLDLALRTADRIWLLADGELVAGTPEDLVLNGAFAQAFRSMGATFDANSGAFTMELPTSAEICVNGSGLAYTWTVRALERAGYAITTDAKTTITITDDHWLLADTNAASRYNTIEDLLAALTQTHHTR